MKFGKAPNPAIIDFTLPEDHIDTNRVFDPQFIGKTEFSIGCAKWNKQDLKGFYPRGIKDELKYYSSQFNCIELNATFYRIFPEIQFQTWYDKTPSDFKFFPKVPQNVSHFGRLDFNSYNYIDEFLNNASALQEKLGTVFLQMHENFSPKDFPKLDRFIKSWPKKIALAVELRHTDWYNNPTIASDLYHLFEENNISNIITDTAGRRDLLHMRLTNTKAFVRFVGANHLSDYTRLDDWIKRIETWTNKGIKEIDFFIHQNLEVESPLLSNYFIKKMNHTLGLDLKVPLTLIDIENQQQSLF